MRNRVNTHAQQVKAAKGPEDIFGRLTSDPATRTKLLELVSEIYKTMAMTLHPDKGGSDVLFSKLVSLRDEALHRINGSAVFKHANGMLAKPITFKTRRGAYTLFRAVALGRACVIYEGILARGAAGTVNVIARVPRSRKDNDLMQREAATFAIFAEKLKKLPPDIAQQLSSRVPCFVETVKLSEPGNKEPRMVNTFARSEPYDTGWFSLVEIRRQYPTGVDPRIAGFIFNRILEGLMFAHKCGVTHGAVTPNHVLIHARTHAGNLIDWTAACHRKAKTVPYIDKEWLPYFPEETIAARISTAMSDVYMAGWCIVYLLGGEPQDRVLPKGIPDPIREVLNRCVQPSSRSRLNAARTHEEFQQALHTAFGPKKFVELKMAE